MAPIQPEANPAVIINNATPRSPHAPRQALAALGGARVESSFQFASSASCFLANT